MNSEFLLDLLKKGIIEPDDMIKALIKFDSGQKQVLASHILGTNPMFVIQEMFMGYKQRKQRKQLYSSDNTLPTTLIKMYFDLGDRIEFETLKNVFVSRYINNESKLEGVHENAELLGLRAMYEYIHSDEINEGFSVYTLSDLHRKLFSKTPFPEFGGHYRNDPIYLPGTGTETCDWRMIPHEMRLLNDDIRILCNIAEEVKAYQDTDLLLMYLDECVILGCKMIKIHPFMDGNGRSVRGFINALLEKADLPPVYIKVNERGEYHKAMNLANNEGNYEDIKNFYRYKVCDSIIELDINQRLKDNSQTKDSKIYIKK